MIVNYSAKSKDFHITTVTDFESYEYNRELIQMPAYNIQNCVCLENYNCCGYIETEPKILSAKKYKTIPRKTIIDESIWDEKYIFKE